MVKLFKLFPQKDVASLMMNIKANEKRRKQHEIEIRKKRSPRRRNP